MQGHAGTQSHHQQSLSTDGSRQASRRSMYTSVLTVVLEDKKHKLPTPRDDTHPQTIMEARCLTERFRQAALCLSYFFRQTRGPLLP